MNCDATFGSREEGAVYRDREGAYLVAAKDGMLAVAETRHGFFLPGGGLERGESHEACIRRECLEELGRDAAVGEYLGVADEYRWNPEVGLFHPIQHYYAGTLGQQVQEISEPDHRYRLISLEEALNGLYLLPQRWAVERLLLRQKENVQKNVDF